MRAKATSRLAASPWVVAAAPPVVAPVPILPPPPARTPIGYDVSYPQCATPLPTDGAFAVVGVNGGLAHNTHPGLGGQLAWAAGSTGVTSQAS